jgi:hypothetical protein
LRLAYRVLVPDAVGFTVWLSVTDAVGFTVWLSVTDAVSFTDMLGDWALFFTDVIRTAVVGSRNEFRSLVTNLGGDSPASW